MMETLLCPKDGPVLFIFSDLVPHLLYYSHLPAMIIASMLGFYILLKNRHSLQSILAFLIFITFSFWTIADLIVWASNIPHVVLFFWSLEILVEPFIFAFGFYFIYVFINEKDLPFKAKLIGILPLLPVILLLPTRYIIENMVIDVFCEGTEGFIAVQYVYPVEVFFVVCSLIYFIYRRRSLTSIQKSKFSYVAIGTILFLTTFLAGNIIGSVTENWDIAQYGILGMTFFAGFLTYAIVKYKAFDIKLATAQALVVAVLILVGAQFLFIQNPVNRILTAIAFILIIGFGWWLVRSVKQEIKQREEMEKLARDLAEANRRRERINKQLQQANIRLKKMDATKSEFLSIASHQLRTPLTVIKGYGSMLLGGDFGVIAQAKQKDAIEKMYVSNNHLIALVENLLNVSRIESGRIKFNFQTQQLEPVVEEIFTNLQQSAKNAGLYLKMDKLDKPLPPVYMDADKIRQVVINFIDNAIKYTREGGITVHLSVKGGQVVCKVADTGIGISKDEQKQLFQKFTRGKDAFLVNTEGTGLGLYVAQMMVKSHQGKIWIESDGVGKGSKFCFSLPAASSVAGKKLQAEAAKLMAEGAQPKGAAEKGVAPFKKSADKVVGKTA